MSPSNSGRDTPDPKRERSRIAQREYRKRHASKFSSLKDENRKLRNALKKIDRVASQRARHDRELQAALAEAREIAGIEEDDSSSALTRVPSPSQRTVSPTRPVSTRFRFSAQPAFFSVAGSGNPLNLQALGLPQQVWLDTDRLVRIYEAPMDAAQYLGDNLFTFAGALYWACTKNTVSLWQAKQLAMMGKVARTESNLDRLFNHSKHLRDHDFLVSLALARLEYHQKGYTHLPPTATQAQWDQIVPDLSKQIERDYVERGETMEWWKTPREVEEFVKRHLEPEEVVELQALIEGRGTSAALAKYTPLVEALVQSFVCFGDGPRWNILWVSMMVGGWRTHQDDEARARAQSQAQDVE
ncbi:hypothetical protein CEP51_006231 [Fusarium floridanum]|uniref:BZIP domain-containing protein n=1 Tax=Fusarium floridanum TaxID=1325733 RepID=A0A428RTV4_9HYPO|nr:hypothetical protein CEP51_006231 [Fusarium floridanum]